jgi:hypothetical protein
MCENFCDYDEVYHTKEKWVFTLISVGVPFLMAVIFLAYLSIYDFKENLESQDPVNAEYILETDVDENVY